MAERLSLTAKYRLQRLILQRGEIQFLIRIKIHCTFQHTEFHWIKVLRTFRYNHNVSPRLTLLRFAHTSCRQEFVVDDKSVIVYKQYVDARFHISVLIGIVEQNHVNILSSLIIGETFDAVASSFVDSHIYVVKLMLHLIRLVANLRHWHIVVGKHIPPALALIATRQHGNLHLVVQEIDEIFHMGSLARTSHSDIAHGNNRYVITLALEYTDVKHPVAHTHPDAIEPAER